MSERVTPMRKRQSKTTFLILGLLIGLLAGCGSSGPKIELPPEPKNASQAELESLFDQISIELAAAKPGSQAATQLETQRRVVGGELANRAAASVRTRLSQVDRIDGKLPLGALERELASLDGIERWDTSVHREIKRELDQELAATRRAIDSRERSLEAVPEDEVLERLGLLSELSALSGTGSAEQARYAEARDQILREVSAEAEEAIRNEDYEKAQDLLGIVQEADPEDEAARKQKCEVDGKVLLKRFSQNLETGRVGRTTEMLTELSESECFEEIREGLAESAAPMAEAFGMLGQEATTAGDLGLAYQRYRDTQLIQELLLEDRGTCPGSSPSFRRSRPATRRRRATGSTGSPTAI